MSQEDAPVPGITRSRERRYERLEREQGTAQLDPAELEQRLHLAEAKLAAAQQQLADEVDQRQALVQALVEIQKRESLSMLASGIAHNFNNLLATILGNAELALIELAPDSPLLASITPIMLAAQRATTLTREMMMYAGAGSLLAQPLDLNDTVASVIHLLGTSVARHVTLTSNLALHVPAIVGDAAQIRQALTHLVTNAVEAIGHAEGNIHVITTVLDLDEITLSTSYRAPDLLAGTYVSLAVEDNGVGMDAATCEKIFDPFFTTKFTGRGLGLAAVRGVVLAHHGALNVESNPGHGSTVQIVLPAIAPDDLFAIQSGC